MQTDPAKVTDTDNSDLPDGLREALAAHQQGQLDVAFPLYKLFLEQNPDHPMGLHLFGLLHSQRGDLQPAIALMQESLSLFSEQPEVANNLGNAFSKLGNFEEAIRSYTFAVQLLPRYLDAHRNLGLCYLRVGDSKLADQCFRRCIELNPEDLKAQLGLGLVSQQQGDLDEAISGYERTLSINPDYADAHHNLGVCLRTKQRPDEAIVHYKRAQELGLDRAELHHNLGNALIDSNDAEAAIDAYQEALKRNPRNLDSHRNLNALLWQQDHLDDYLQSYVGALDTYPDAEPLRLAYAMALNQQEAFADAERVLEDGLRHTPESSELQSLLAFSLEGQDRWADALQMHAAAVDKGPATVPNHRISYARALLACERPDEALTQAELGAVLMPFDQRALAYLGLCWRVLGDERDKVLNDYENLVQIIELPVPADYSGSREFNERLATALDPLHIGKRHPAEQTLRGGSQTSGNLFDRHEPEIQALVTSLRQCVSEYIDRLPGDKEHPLLVRRSEQFDFPASWSVRLADGGYHTTHVHPLGWISSAYYVQVPPEVAAADTRGGWLQFGVPDIDIGAHGEARRWIQPEVGQLVLFPSYMWHGTEPFKSNGPRMTVAFDVEPRK